MTDTSIEKKIPTPENINSTCNSCKPFPDLCPNHLLAFQLGINDETLEYIIEVYRRYGYYTMQQWLGFYFKQKQFLWEAKRIEFKNGINNSPIWIYAFEILGFTKLKAIEMALKIDDDIFSTLDSPYAHAMRSISFEFKYNEILKEILEKHFTPATGE